MSALDIADSLDHLFRTVMTMTVSGGALVVRTTGLSRKDILAGMLDFVAKFMTPLVAQLDPSIIHRSTGQLKVAQDYAERILALRTRKTTSGLDIPKHLVSQYPSHRFVIGPQEAGRLGLPVQACEAYDHWTQARKVFREYEASSRDTLGVYS